MWSLSKGINFTFDAVKIMFHDYTQFYKEDFWAAMNFVVKEKIWGIIATILGLAVLALTIGVKFAIASGDDYASTFIHDTFLPDMKSLWNSYKEVPTHICHYFVVIAQSTFGWDMMKQFPGQASWVHLA